MDGLTDGRPGQGAGGTGVLGALGLPGGPTDDDAVRLFGAAYRMLGSARGAAQVLRDALGGSAPGAFGAGGGEGQGDAGGGGNSGGAAPGDPYRRLVREVFALALRRGAGRPRRDVYAQTATWLPEPVLTAGGVLGPLDTAVRRESVSMGRLVLLERMAPAERAAFVCQEVFGFGPADAAAVLGVPEDQYRTRERRARNRLLEAESVVRGPASTAQRWSAVADLLGGIKEEDAAALEELLADDVVAWSDGGWQPDVVRRPVLGAVKVGRFLSAVLGRTPQGTRAHIVEVNGDPALVGVVGEAVVGVLAPEFGPQGMVGIRAVADPARLEFVSRQWAGRSGAVTPAGPADRARPAGSPERPAAE